VTVIGDLARECCELRLSELSAADAQHVAVVVADTIGVIVGGAQTAELRALVKPRRASGEEGPCDVLVPGAGRRGELDAAFFNGCAATFLELDEGMRPTGHPASHVVPAALACAQATESSGRDLLEAVLSGYEITARLFRAYRLRYPAHPHGHFGAVGAAVAVARLRGEDPGGAAEVAAALPVASVWQPCFEGATVRNVYSGLASWIGAMSVGLAASGFTGSASAQEAVFTELLGRVEDPGVLQGVDRHQVMIAKNYFKFHSACAMTHSAIDAAIASRASSREGVTFVEVETIEVNQKLNRLPVDNPLSKRFSLPHAVAVALLHGSGDPGSFAYEGEVADLAHRVVVRESSDLNAEWPDSAPVRLILHRPSGREEIVVGNPCGYPGNQVEREALRSKFERLTGMSGDDTRVFDFDALCDLAEVATCSDLFSRSKAVDSKAE